MGGNTLSLALKVQPEHKHIERFAALNPNLVVDGVLGEQDSVLVGRKSEAVGFEIWRPRQAFENDDLEPSLAALVSPPCWLLQVTTETDPPDEDWDYANSFARFMALKCQGAVFYDELGKIIWPEGIEQIPVKRRERVDVVNLSWFIHSSRMSVNSVKTFLELVKNLMPEARPLRFDTTEPMQGRLTNHDDQPFLDAWIRARESDDVLLHFTAKNPCFGGFFGFPVRLGLAGRELRSSEDNMRVHLEFDRAAGAREKYWSDRITALFAEVAQKIGCFYAHAYVERNYFRYRGLSFDAETEQYPLPLGSEWYGLPPAPTWLSWFGRSYGPLVLEAVRKFNPTISGEGLLVRLGDKPMDLAQLEGVTVGLPAELIAQEEETSLMMKEHRGRWLGYRAKSADFIPRIDV